MSKTISIVVPAFNEAQNIPTLVDAILDAIPDKYIYQIIFVDDGSKDDSLSVLDKIGSEHPEVGYISFSRNFGHQAALRAGLRAATGDAIISMDADLQHPPHILPILIEQWEGGHDIVYTRRKDSSDTGLIKRLTSKMFYRLLNYLSGLSMDEGAADFRLIDRKVADVINMLPESNLFLRGFITWCGFSVAAIDYVPAERFAGRSKYSFSKMLSLALKGITQFSVKPLRIASILGVVSAMVGVLYGIFAIWSHFYIHQTVSGWTSVVISVMIMGGIQLVVLGIIGEYLGETFMQTKQRPDYIIKEKKI